MAPFIIDWYCRFELFISAGTSTNFSNGFSTIRILNSHPLSRYRKSSHRQSVGFRNLLTATFFKEIFTVQNRSANYFNLLQAGCVESRINSSTIFVPIRNPLHQFMVTFFIFCHWLLKGVHYLR